MNKTIPTPEQAAASTRQKREAEYRGMTSVLFDYCLLAMEEYDGKSALCLDGHPELMPYVAAVQAIFDEQGSKWCTAVVDGKLLLGTADDIIAATTIGPVEIVVSPLEPQPAPGTVTAAQEPPPAGNLTAEITAEPASNHAVEIIAEPTSNHGADITAENAITPGATSVSFSPLANAEQGTAKLPLTTLSGALQHVLCGQVEACGASTDAIVRGMGFHGLIETVHCAFADHYGVRLSPDHIWLTIEQGFANLVNQEPELFRGKFVSHEGKQKIEIRRDGFVLGSPNNDWVSCFSEFSDAIRGFIGDEKHALLVSDFSTTGAIERAASEVVLMDTVQSYFTYRVETRCGIPSITLDGAVADWEKLQEKLKALRQFGDLAWWLNDVDAIVAQFVSAAKGDVDSNFWNSIYKYKSQSGGTQLTGWIVKLLPLVKTYTGKWQRNPLLGHHMTAYERPKGRVLWSNGAEIQGESLNTSSLPASLSTVPFEWNYLGNLRKYQFIAGIIGYSQSEDGKVLTPVMGWGVRPAK